MQFMVLANISCVVSKPIETFRHKNEYKGSHMSAPLFADIEDLTCFIEFIERV